MFLTKNLFGMVNLPKIAFTAILCCIPVSSLAQGRIVLSRGLFKPQPPIIKRTLTVPIRHGWVADKALLTYNPTRLTFTNTSSHITFTLEKEIAAKTLKSPTAIHGPYTYTRAISTVSQDHSRVDPRYLSAWKYINQYGNYNGSHHIVNKTTIAAIHADLTEKGYKISLEEMQNDAPALFHPLHDRPQYKKIFHDAKWQYETYQKMGMEALLLYQFDKLHALNADIGLSPIPDEVIDGILKEAELWCTQYHLYWHDPSTYNTDFTPKK